MLLILAGKGILLELASDKPAAIFGKDPEARVVPMGCLDQKLKTATSIESWNSCKFVP
jgi:hypothetical protein